MRYNPPRYDHDEDPHGIHDDSNDYKYAAVAQSLVEELESTNNWIYVGADARDDGYTKVGMTGIELHTRESSTHRPTYFQAVAFKCRHDLTRETIKAIETDLHDHLEDLNEGGVLIAERELRVTSGRPSEVFNSDHREHIIKAVYDRIVEKHLNSFVGVELVVELEDGSEIEQGSSIKYVLDPANLSPSEVEKYKDLLKHYD